MIQNGDFVTIDYTGRLEDGTVFDTTHASVGNAAGMTKEAYAPVTVCVGQGMLVMGLDHALIGKGMGAFKATLEPQSAFGKKDPKLVRVVPTEQLKKQGIRAAPGMQLSVDGEFGVVLRTGGGRTMVDFNHPLASRNVVYDVTVHAIVTDAAAQVKALLEQIGLGAAHVRVEGTGATIALPSLPPQPYMDAIQEKITQLTSVKTVSFEAGKKSI
jgi:FKBP-type peptidyl-prolyl cis-trans isomerase SlyD